ESSDEEEEVSSSESESSSESSESSVSESESSEESESDDESETDDSNVPLTKRKKERKIAEKLADERDLGGTRFEESEGEFWKTPVKDILIPERNFRKSKKYPNPRETFIDSTTHELAHASEEVRFHPDFNPYSTEFEEECEEYGKNYHPRCLELKKEKEISPLLFAKVEQLESDLSLVKAFNKDLQKEIMAMKSNGKAKNREGKKAFSL
ncbi:694_t:CDS:2, partial [Scutellospora calospora]